VLIHIRNARVARLLGRQIPSRIAQFHTKASDKHEGMPVDRRNSMNTHFSRRGAMSLVLAASVAVAGTGLVLGQGSAAVSTVDLKLTGITQPADKREVPSAMRGILAEVNVKEGQHVKKNQPLGKLDDLLQRDRVDYERVGSDSDVEVQTAQSDLELAQVEYDKTKRVAAGLEVKQKEIALNKAKIALQAAQENKQKSHSLYQSEKDTLDRMTLRSPIEGSILRVNKQPGEQTDDNPVFIVVQTNKLNAIFDAPKQLFGKITDGDRVPLDLEGVKRDGVVVAIDPIIDPAGQIFRVKLEVDNSDGKLAAGVTAVWNWSKK
jgi:RND family efflux transporter MFP subunit